MSHRLFRDGDQWCAVGHHFVDLQTSPAGFGDTQQEAVNALRNDGAYQTMQRRINAPLAELADFVTVESP